MSSQKYISSITEMVPEDFPTLTPLSEPPTSTTTSASASNSDSFMGYFENMTLQTWVIIILILAFLGINIFAYLAKGTEETVTVFSKIFEPVLKFFGYSTLSTTKQAIETSATGTKAGVDIIAGATTGAIDTIQQTSQSEQPLNKSNSLYSTNNNIFQGKSASSSLPVQHKIQQDDTNYISENERLQKDSLSRALEHSSKNIQQVRPDDSRSSIQTTGKPGWCYIGEDQGIRTCSEIGVNDVCMSGDIFPTQSVCVNPNLRA